MDPTLQFLHPLWQEFIDYLNEIGEDFNYDLAKSRHVIQLMYDEAVHYKDVGDFYAQSLLVQYHLIGTYLEGWKRLFYIPLLSLTACGQPLYVLDYGCGIGLDGISFLEMGYFTYFADIPGRSLDYLRWRLNKRGYTHEQCEKIVFPIQAGWMDNSPLICPRANIVWCKDVVEHCPRERQQWFLCEYLPSLADVVMVVLQDTPQEQLDGKVHVPWNRMALDAHLRKSFAHVTAMGFCTNNTEYAWMYIYGKNAKPMNIPLHSTLKGW